MADHPAGHPADLVEDPRVDPGADSETEITKDLRRNMMLFAQNAESNAKFHSNLPEANLFFAAIASGKARVQETVQ